MPEKVIDTLADLLAQLATFEELPDTTPVRFIDPTGENTFVMSSSSHWSKPKQFLIRIEKKLDREYVVAGIRARLRNAEDDIAELVEKIDRQRATLTSRMETRDQCIEMLAMIDKENKKK